MRNDFLVEFEDEHTRDNINAALKGDDVKQVFDAMGPIEDNDLNLLLQANRWDDYFMNRLLALDDEEMKPIIDQEYISTVEFLFRLSRIARHFLTENIDISIDVLNCRQQLYSLREPFLSGKLDLSALLLLETCYELLDVCEGKYSHKLNYFDDSSLFSVRSDFNVLLRDAYLIQIEHLQSLRVENTTMAALTSVQKLRLNEYSKRKEKGLKNLKRIDPDLLNQRITFIHARDDVQIKDDPNLNPRQSANRMISFVKSKDKELGLEYKDSNYLDPIYRVVLAYRKRKGR